MTVWSCCWKTVGNLLDAELIVVESSGLLDAVGCKATNVCKRGGRRACQAHTFFDFRRRAILLDSVQGQDMASKRHLSLTETTDPPLSLVSRALDGTIIRRE
ncbi:hypothetical protein VC83_07838 [Pseudogymnoascus destructans]|uniref:Uncharacterized protein n=1 Tax=Pseudogymnoascus destructans TaxID=655981 RepID=A0A177A0Z7_9PEZI|nr:uncharacterized protein VC83_07838 [Pseudogymnoascus destructans]OAF55828.1 hypothetical protein VC83_07838 [Pseudogymnoascus destructans]